YRESHLDRLRLIRELQREHLPLAEIRSRLERLNDDQVHDLLNVGDSLPEPRGTAFDYIQSILAGTNRRAFSLPMPPAAAAKRSLAAVAPPPAPGAPAKPVPDPAPAAPTAAYAAEVPTTTQPSDSSPTNRSQWERIALTTDVELHVRRPQSRLHNRAVDRLVALARQLLEEETQ